MLYRYSQFKPEVDESVFIAPNAVVIGQVKIASGASVWFHTLIRGDINTIEIGKDSNIQDGCTMHVTNEHAVKIEERVTVGHNVILHGCHVKSNCLIGMGSVLLDGVVINEGCLVAAGCVVSPNTVIPANSLVMGVPGKVVRTLNEKERERMSTNWKSYVEYAKSYKDPSVFEQIE